MERKNETVRYQALLQILRTADILWNASHAFFARWNISPSQFNVLNLLFDRPDGLSQIELGRQLIVHRSNVTGLVDRLERRRLVRRKNAQDDRRAYCVVLTPPGRRLIRAILPEYYAMAQKVWGAFPAARARQLAADLQTLFAQAEKLGPGKEPL